MITRELKLKLNRTQEEELNQWLWYLTGLYNWTIRKIELDANDKIYHSEYALKKLLNGHSKKIGIPISVMRGTLMQAYTAWQRCFKKLAKKPRLKGNRNKLNSIAFVDDIKTPGDNQITLLGIGKVHYHKQELPEAQIKCGRIVKRASGWYLILWLDTIHQFPVKDTEESVGIDFGFQTLLTLSNGAKIENPRELRKGAVRLAQAQRSGNKKLVARIQERQANRRKDRNHKLSRKLLENHKNIFYGKDNLKGLRNTFGKSISEAGHGQLIAMLNYKGRNVGRNVVAVESKNTTKTCSACGALSGPTGWEGLKVRHWDCACGAQHDRDINSACNILIAGVGMTHEAVA